MKTDQDKNEEYEDFLHRIDTLQFKLGVRRAEVCRYVGISEGKLSQIRNGVGVIASKFWSRLEAAERKAGIKSLEELPKGIPGLYSDKAAREFTPAFLGMLKVIQEASKAAREAGGSSREVDQAIQLACEGRLIEIEKELKK